MTDYRQLLKEYMHDVLEAEGVSFVDPGNEALRAVEDEVLAEIDAARSTQIHTPPPNSDFARAIAEAAVRPMTSQEIWDQRVSFMYGNLPEENPLTREQVAEIAAQMYGPRPKG